MASSVCLRLLLRTSGSNFLTKQALVAPHALKYSAFIRSVCSVLYRNNIPVIPSQRHLPVATASRMFSQTDPAQKADDKVLITFIDRDGDKTTINARIGDSLLDVAKDNDIDLEGACEGTLACSTCHLIFEPEQFDSLPLEPPSEEELDMLDLAYGLTDTSRLGCQIIVTKELDGLVLTVPSGTSDARLA